MGSRSRIAGLSLVALLLVHAPALTQQNPYRLKEPDQKKVCLSCHSDFEEKLKKRHVHSAVQAGECSGCHDPHVSTHGKLLAADMRQICATCHESVIPANARSTHKVVADGECEKCHDPHASDNPANLVARGNDLCVACHTAIGEAVQKAKFKHDPVERGCLTCHAAHGSDKSAHLLSSPVPGLCVGCHKPDTAAFAAQHTKYPVGKASCTSCHDPHGSDTPALLYNTVHAPITNHLCAQCHEPADAPSPFATRRPGFELCKGCHNDMVTATLAKGRLHWPVASQDGCVSCHNPHAAKQPKLLRAETSALCGRCHADTVKRIAATAVKHAPVDTGMCVSCHSPHAASGPYLMDQPSTIELCSSCHDYTTHSAHPIGAEAVDPRNKNLRVDCLSCHKGHGTDHKWMLLAATNLELCTQCHKQFGR